MAKKKKYSLKLVKAETQGFSQPIQQVVLMLISLFLVMVGSYFMFPSVAPIFLSSPYLNGVILERKIISWIEKKGYDLNIGRVNGRQSHVSWRIEDISENKSALTIKVHPWMMNQGNKLFQFLPFQLFVKPQLKLYLKSVLRGLKWYTKHNKPTPRNHFGKLAWFS